MLKVEIIGNLGKNASIQNINGKEYVSFNVAHSEKRNGQEVTTWASVLWYGNGGGLFQYLKSGVRVFVRGDLYTKIYTRKDGTQDVSLSVMAREIQICQYVLQEQQTESTQPLQPVRQVQPTQQVQPAHPRAASQPLINQSELTPHDDDLPF